MQTSGLPEIKTIPDIEVRTGQFFLEYSESLECARRTGIQLKERNHDYLEYKANVLIAEKTSDGRIYDVMQWLNEGKFNKETYCLDYTYTIRIVLKNIADCLPGEHLWLEGMFVGTRKISFSWYAYQPAHERYRVDKPARAIAGEVREFQKTPFSWQRVDNYNFYPVVLGPPSIAEWWRKNEAQYDFDPEIVPDKHDIEL
jgi:hypothetical protein